MGDCADDWGEQEAMLGPGLVNLERAQKAEAERDALRDENSRLTTQLMDYIAIGDRLQSEASRLAEWAENQGGMPYEVHHAFLGVRSAVKEWTRARVACLNRESRA